MNIQETSAECWILLGTGEDTGSWKNFMEKMNLGEKSKSQIDNNTCFILVDCICCQERKT